MPFDDKGNWYPPGGFNTGRDMRALKDYGVPPTQDAPPAPNFRMLDDQSLTQPMPKAPTFVDRLYSALDNPISRGIDAFQEKAAGALTFGLTDKWNQWLNKGFADKGAQMPQVDFGGTAEKIGGGLGTFAGSVLPIGGAYKATGGFAKTLLPNAPKLIDRLGRGALAGTAYGLADQGIDSVFDTHNNGSQTPGQRAGAIGTNAALFGVGDAALSGIGMGAKKISDATGFTNWITNAFKGAASRLSQSSAEMAPTLDTSLPSLQTPARTQFNSTLRATDPKQQAMQEFEQGVEKVRNYIQHDDILAAYPEGTPIESALADIHKNTGVDLAGLLQKVEQQPSSTLGTQLSNKASVSRLGRVAGALEPKPIIPNRPLLPQMAMKDSALNISPAAEVAAGREQVLNSSPEPDIIHISKIPKQNNLGIDATKFKDYSGFKFNSTDVYRNLRDVSGDQFPALQKNILQPFDNAKSNFAQMQKDYLGRLKTDIVDGLGIKKGSKLSSLVQQYGEKKLTLDELKKQTPDWQKVVAADDWFRKNYDELINKVNATREQLYPNNPEKIVPKRDDYYRHFQEFNGLTGLKNLFDTPSAIDPSLVGVSEFTKPNSKFAGFMQKRGLGPYKNDAVGGFLNYVKPAAYATHIDPQIGAFKDLAKTVADQTADTKNANNFINFVDKFAQDLAGKTNAADRYVQDNIPGGRRTMAIIQWINNRVKANVILGNVGSTLAQVANIPNGIAFAKHHAVPGAGRTLLSFIKPSEAMNQSGFLKERFIGKDYRQFDSKLLEQPKVFAEWMMETADRVGTGFVWNSAYSKGLAQKVADPIKYADDEARKLVAGRGVGEVPLMQKSKLFQLAMPFQLEVANQWRVMKDFVSAKDFAGLALLFVASNLLNEGMKQVRGSRAVLDPIQAIKDAMQEDLTPLQRAGRIGGEILSNLPGGQTIAGLYPEYGKQFLGLENVFGDLPTRKQLFGDSDPTRFGSGIVAAGAVQSPLYKLLLPFGGGQLKKSLDGLSANLNDGAYQRNFASEPFAFGKYDSNQLKYPIPPSAAKDTQSLLFGPAATQEGQSYYKDNRRPLSDKQTVLYDKASGDKKQQFYDGLMKQRDIDSTKTKLDNIAKDPKLSKEEKQAKMVQIINKFREQSK